MANGRMECTYNGTWRKILLKCLTRASRQFKLAYFNKLFCYLQRKRQNWILCQFSLQLILKEILLSRFGTMLKVCVCALVPQFLMPTINKIVALWTFIYFILFILMSIVDELFVFPRVPSRSDWTNGHDRWDKTGCTCLPSLLYEDRGGGFWLSRWPLNCNVCYS